MLSRTPLIIRTVNKSIPKKHYDLYDIYRISHGHDLTLTLDLHRSISNIKPLRQCNRTCFTCLCLVTFLLPAPLRTFPAAHVQTLIKRACRKRACIVHVYGALVESRKRACALLERLRAGWGFFEGGSGFCCLWSIKRLYILFSLNFDFYLTRRAARKAAICSCVTRQHPPITVAPQFFISSA